MLLCLCIRAFAVFEGKDDRKERSPEPVGIEPAVPNDPEVHIRDVGDEPLEKILSAQFHDCRMCHPVFLVGEGNRAPVIGEDFALRNGRAFGVAANVADNRCGIL